MKKFFGLVAALLAVSLVSFGFVACSDDDDDDPVVINYIVNDVSNAAVKATYAGVESGTDDDGIAYTANVTVTFYEDDTWKTDTVASALGVIYMETDGSGTYTGDPSKDGTIVVKKLKTYSEGEVIQDYSSYASLTSVSTITISDGKFKFESVEFTKQ